MVADGPHCKIDLKSSHCQILSDQKAKKEQQNSQPIPVVRDVDNRMIQRN